MSNSPNTDSSAHTQITREVVRGQLLTDKQEQRLSTVLADEAHHAVEATWGVHQRVIAAYRDPDRAAGEKLLIKIIAAIGSGVPATLPELRKLGRAR